MKKVIESKKIELILNVYNLFYQNCYQLSLKILIFFSIK